MHRGDIYCHAHGCNSGLAPSAGLEARLAQNPLPNRDNEAAFFCDANELNRRHKTASRMTPAQERSLLIYWGSTQFYSDLAAHGSKVDVDAYVRDWQAKAAIYQQQSRKYWLYH